MMEKLYQHGKKRSKITETSRHPRSEYLYICNTKQQRKPPNTSEQKMPVKLSGVSDAREGLKPGINQKSKAKQTVGHGFLFYVMKVP